MMKPFTDNKSVNLKYNYFEIKYKIKNENDFNILKSIIKNDNLKYMDDHESDSIFKVSSKVDGIKYLEYLNDQAYFLNIIGRDLYQKNKRSINDKDCLDFYDIHVFVV
jgi:hypothetical protein